MPFGCTNSPVVFQALVSDVLWDFINQCAFIYLDIIMFFSHNSQEHHQDVHLLENNLFVKAEKCEFHIPSVTFPSYITEEGKVKVDLNGPESRH